MKLRQTTLTIGYTGGSFTYAIDPSSNIDDPNKGSLRDAKKANVKRGDSLHFRCSVPDCAWTVYFKDVTPLQDGRGLPVASLSGTNVTPQGSFISPNAIIGESYDYGVILKLGGSSIVIDDPQVIIES